MDIENMALSEQQKLIQASIEANQDKMSNITINAFTTYQAEANQFVKDNKGKADEAIISRTVQEMLVKKLSESVIAAFQLGYTSGMNVAFDIIEAKAMEMSGGTCSTVN